MKTKLARVKEMLQKSAQDGWLLYDFRRSNRLAVSFLQIPEHVLLSRRFFYWISAKGGSVKIVNRIEADVLDHLPGDKILYSTWQELDTALRSVLSGCKKVAMEYSPRAAIPTVSLVDAGTCDLVRQFGVQIESSAELLQEFTSRWTERQFELHLQACKALEETVECTWDLIARCLSQGLECTEYTVQQFIARQIAERGFVMEGAPICAVNRNSAKPHYCPSAEAALPIVEGDFVLIDLWCKRPDSDAVYGDITRVGVASKQATVRQMQVFAAVKAARDAATALVRKRFEQRLPICGWEVDAEARGVIKKTGFGQYFIHRTGHNIHIAEHGDGAHMDNWETHDTRPILTSTCFSIEPGVYIPEEFGVRLEYDVCIRPNGDVLVTGGEQQELECILARIPAEADARG